MQRKAGEVDCKLMFRVKGREGREGKGREGKGREEERIDEG